MKKIILFFVAGFAFLLANTAFASSSITYCSKYENYQCVEYASSLGELLNELSGIYYEPLHFEANDEYTYFEDAYFKFYIPNYVTEFQLITEYGYSFSPTNWYAVDENRNKIHDDIDDVIEAIQSIEGEYFGDKSTYKLDKWEGKLPILIDYSCYYTSSGNSCAMGLYSPSDSYAQGYGITEDYLMVDPEGILVGPLSLDRDKKDVKSTIAHEMFHAIQNVYISDSFFWDSYQYDNFFEGLAVTMQRNLVSSSKEYLNFLEDAAYQYPQYSMFGPTPAGEMANYGAFMWYNFLERKYGKDVIEKLLDSYSESGNYNSAYRSFLAASDAIEKEGGTIYDAYLEYVTWNYDKEKYSYGDSLKETYITKSHKSFPTGNIMIDETEAPALFASNYVEFDMGSGNKNLDVTFTGNLDADMYVSFLSVDDGDVDYDKTIEYFVEKGGTESFVIPSYGKDTVVMIVSVLDVSDSGDETSNAFYDYVYPYTYSADKVDAVEEQTSDEVIDETISLDDYFLFEPDKEWKYSLSWLNDSGSEEKDDYTVRTVNCASKSNCITYETDGGSDVSYHFFSDSVYVFETDGDSISQFKMLSKEAISQVLDKEAYELFGIDELENIKQASFSCSMEAVDNYSYKNLQDSAVKETCKYSLVDDVGVQTSIDEISYYLKGIGLVNSVSDYSDGNGVFVSYETSLASTNFVDITDVVDVVSENAFSDLADSHKNIEAILYLKNQGVISGYPDGSFKPENPVNRAELLKILVEGKGVTPVVDDYSNCFSDVKTDWYAPYVCYAKEQGWVDGYPDGSFKPAQTVNKVEAIKMLLNSQGIDIPESITEKPFDDVDTTDWFAVFITKAKELGILEETGSDLAPAEGMKRAGICENLYRLLTL